MNKFYWLLALNVVVLYILVFFIAVFMKWPFFYYMYIFKMRKTRKRSNKSEITGFYMKNIAHLLGFSTGFCSPYFSSSQFYGGRCWKASISISCCRGRWFTCNKPMKLSAFLTLVEQMIGGFYPSSFLPCL